jgi:hypothetical protein
MKERERERERVGHIPSMNISMICTGSSITMEGWGSDITPPLPEIGIDTHHTPTTAVENYHQLGTASTMI